MRILFLIVGVWILITHAPVDAPQHLDTHTGNWEKSND